MIPTNKDENRLAILAATWEELESLAGPLKATPLAEPWRRVLQGKWKALRVLLVETGVGKVNAAVTTALTIEKWGPSLLLLTGTAGAYPSSGLSPLDLALATEEIYGDEGSMTEEGWLTPKNMNTAYLVTEKDQFHHRFPLFCPDSLISSIPRGPFITLSAITGKEERAKELEALFPKALCENMEGAAVAHVAAFYRTPLIEVRAVSNMVGKRERDKWKVEEASRTLAAFILDHLLPQLGTLNSLQW